MSSSNWKKTKQSHKHTKRVSPGSVAARSKRPRIRTKPFHFWWVVVLVLVGGISAWALGWWQFGVTSSTAQAGVTVQIKAPLTASSGEIQNITIEVSNNERSQVRNAELSMVWPEGVRIVDSQPAAQQSSYRSWTVPDIAIGQSYTIEIEAQIFGAVADVKRLQATLVYQLGNFSSDFFVESVHELTVGEPVLNVVLEGPDEIAPLLPGQWRYVLTNDRDQALEHGYFDVVLPTGFEVDTVSGDGVVITQQQQQRARFEINDMPAGEKVVVKIEGVFAAGTQGKQTFVWQFGYEDIDQVLSVVQEAATDTFIVGDEIEIDLLVNGESAPLEISWGDTATVVVRAVNITSVDITDIEWTITATEQVIDWARVNSSARISIPSAGTIIITPEENDILQSLASSDAVEITIALPLLSNPGTPNALSVSATVRAAEIGDTPGDGISFSDSIQDIPIRKAVTWHSNAQYYNDEGIMVGSGPLPPEVGQPTNYRIYWSVSEVSDDIQQIEIATVLPAMVGWLNEAGANSGSVSYVSGSRRVVWKVPNVQSHTSGEGEMYGDFMLRLIPSEQTTGQIVPLTGEIVLTATRADGSTIILPTIAVTTALEGDLYAHGQGVVVQVVNQ